jgi:hypothetical protein
MAADGEKQMAVDTRAQTREGGDPEVRSELHPGPASLVRPSAEAVTTPTRVAIHAVLPRRARRRERRLRSTRAARLRTGALLARTAADVLVAK